MSLSYYFESPHIPRTLSLSRPSDLCVIDTDSIHISVIRGAVERGVWDGTTAGREEGTMDCE